MHLGGGRSSTSHCYHHATPQTMPELSPTQQQACISSSLICAPAGVQLLMLCSKLQAGCSSAAHASHPLCTNRWVRAGFHHGNDNTHKTANPITQTHFKSLLVSFLSASIPLSKATHMTKPKGKRWRNTAHHDPMARGWVSDTIPREKIIKANN